MRVLSLLTQYSHSAPWASNTTSIDSADSCWSERSLWSKAWRLVRIAPAYNFIFFYQDIRLPVLFWVFACLRRAKPPETKLVFVALLCDVSRFHAPFGFSRQSLYDRARWFYYAWFTHIHYQIVVHSAAEVGFYARTFGVPRERFCFIPFHVRRQALSGTIPAHFDATSPYILTAGRHRDVATFCAALADTPLQGIVVRGAEERAAVAPLLPPNVRAYYELPIESYRGLFAGAQIFVVALYATRWQRSLGQIAAFEAIANGVPVIAARTFQLADYFCEEHEILCYEPENAVDLKRQIDRLLRDPALARLLSKNAHARMVTSYTEEHYVGSLLDIIKGTVSR
jgi:glycosyltransferase involved in cell wall biosynthesis